jgi:hypothetical protein
MASPAQLLLNRNIYRWRTTGSVCCIDFHRYEVFIGVQGGVTDFVKSVTRQVVVGRPSHVASWPLSLASTDLQLGIPLYRLLESVTVKPTQERCKVGPAGHPLAHWSSDFAHCLHIGTYVLDLALNLVKFQVSL